MNKHGKRLVISSILAATAATVVLGFTAPALAHDTLKLEAPKPLLAPTPPMGWSSWNKFACNVNEKRIREQADAMVASGMKDAGYWTTGAQHFPDLVKAIVDGAK